MLLLLREHQERAGERRLHGSWALGGARSQGEANCSPFIRNARALLPCKAHCAPVHLDPGAEPHPTRRVGGKSGGWEAETSQSKKHQGSPESHQLSAKRIGYQGLVPRSHDERPPSTPSSPSSAFCFASSLFPSPLNPLHPAQLRPGLSPARPLLLPSYFLAPPSPWGSSLVCHPCSCLSGSWVSLSSLYCSRSALPGAGPPLLPHSLSPGNLSHYAGFLVDSVGFGAGLSPDATAHAAVPHVS